MPFPAERESFIADEGAQLWAWLRGEVAARSGGRRAAVLGGSSFRTSHRKHAGSIPGSFRTGPDSGPPSISARRTPSADFLIASRKQFYIVVPQGKGARRAVSSHPGAIQADPGAALATLVGKFFAMSPQMRIRLGIF